MDDMDDDMAATMGFSSFGNTKKRKFDMTNSPRSKAEASGANTTKLGVRVKSEAEADDAETSAAAESVEAEQVPTNTHSESHQPASTTDSKAKRKQKETQSAASGLADFLSRGRALPEKPPSATVETTAPPEPAADIAAAQADPAASEMVSFGGTPISRAHLKALQYGVPDQNGDKAFFLPSFVEDPWQQWKSEG